MTVKDGEKHYAHQVLLAVVCAAEQAHVVCLEPEFILPQDGHEKQDCEQQAIKRWVERNARRFHPWSVTVLADDLHCHQPTCELLLKHKLHSIVTCKPESHPTLYEELRLLERVEGAISTKAVRRELGARSTFFNDLRALIRYHYFASLRQLLTFMYQRLELGPEAP